jgi:16S rRNA (guanine527-N7)-methyltransferase
VANLVQVSSAADFQRVFGVSRETCDRLDRYVQTLLQWQGAVNLVSQGTLGDVWHRHIADSAQLFFVVKPAKDCLWVDIGAGAGFPGLVVAVLMAEAGGGRVILVESDTRKCAFLREVVRKTGLAQLLAVDILTGRVESSAIQAKLRASDVYSARALAPLNALLSLVGPVFGPNSVGAFPKGRDAVKEIEQAQKTWSFDVVRVPSLTDSEGELVLVRNLRSKPGH